MIQDDSRTEENKREMRYTLEQLQSLDGLCYGHLTAQEKRLHQIMRYHTVELLAIHHGLFNDDNPWLSLKIDGKITLMRSRGGIK